MDLPIRSGGRRRPGPGQRAWAGPGPPRRGAGGCHRARPHDPGPDRSTTPGLGLARPPGPGDGWAAHEHQDGWHHDREHFGGDTRLYGGGEFLLWWINGFNTPPLVTTGPATATAGHVATSGFLGGSGVSTLAGGERLDGNDPYYGGRFTLGLWLEDEHTLGVEGNFLFLGRRSQDSSFNSAEFPVLTRPFTLASNGQSFGQIVAMPGVHIPGDGTAGTVSTGSVAVNSQSEMWGGEVNLRTNLCHDCRSYLDLVGGFRYLELDESLTINEATVAGPGMTRFFPSLAGTAFQIADRFATQNRFYGGQVGVAGEFFLANRLSVGGAAEVAIGATYESIEVQGSTLSIKGATSTAVKGGLLALPSNSGRFHRDPFAVLPDGTLNVGYYVTPHLRLSVGYDSLYWSRVARPGDQIDTTVDASKVPSFRGLGFAAAPIAHPVPTLKESDFWAEGVNVGLEFRW